MGDTLSLSRIGGDKFQPQIRVKRNFSEKQLFRGIDLCGKFSAVLKPELSKAEFRVLTLEYFGKS